MLRTSHVYAFGVTGLLLIPILVIVATTLAAPTTGGNYNAAMNAHPGNMVVFLTTKGCPPCAKLKSNLMIAMDRAGILEDSSIVVISYQKQPKLVRQLSSNSHWGFPELVVFRHGMVWRRSGNSSQVVLTEWFRNIKQSTQRAR